jgi:hypothetical protein
MASIQARLTQAMADRVQVQLDALEVATNRPALAAPGGRVQRLGGNPLTPRARQLTGATPTGAPIQYNQGILAGQPLLPPPPETARPQPPVLTAAGNPNDLDGDDTGKVLQPRFNLDLAVDSTTGAAYYWDNVASSWVVIGTARQKRGLGIAAPAVQQYPFMIGGDPATEDQPRLLQALRLTWRNQNGTTGTAGAAALLLNGSAVTLGTTQMATAGDYLALNVTNAGSADYLLAEVFFTLV